MHLSMLIPRGGAVMEWEFNKLCFPVGEGFEVFKLPGSVGF